MPRVGRDPELSRVSDVLFSSRILAYGMALADSHVG
jgi:hypothetical protein